MNRVRQLSAAGLLGIVMIFELAAFALLSLRDESFDYKALAFAGGLIVVLLLQYIIILWISKYADRFILVIASTEFHQNIICLMDIFQCLLCTDDARQPSSVFSCDVVFAIGESTGTRHAFHDAARRAAQAVLGLAGNNRTVSLI